MTGPAPEPTGPPYVPASEVIVVRVTARGGVYDGQVLGWRGDRVCVSYRTEVGNHLAWVQAVDIERHQHMHSLLTGVPLFVALRPA